MFESVRVQYPTFWSPALGRMRKSRRPPVPRRSGSPPSEGFPNLGKQKLQGVILVLLVEAKSMLAQESRDTSAFGISPRKGGRVISLVGKERLTGLQYPTSIRNTHHSSLGVTSIEEESVLCIRACVFLSLRRSTSVSLSKLMKLGTFRVGRETPVSLMLSATRRGLSVPFGVYL